MRWRTRSASAARRRSPSFGRSETRSSSRSRRSRRVTSPQCSPLRSASEAAGRNRGARGRGRGDRGLPHVRPLRPRRADLYDGRLRAGAEVEVRGARRRSRCGPRARRVRVAVRARVDPARGGRLRRGRRRAERRRVQRLPAVGATRTDRRDLPVVPRQRRRQRCARGALRRPSAARGAAGGCFAARVTENRRAMGRMLAVAAAACLVAPAVAAASVTVATNVQRPALRVDAKGNAEVSWTAGGRRQYLLVPPTGRFLPGGRLPRGDVSRPVSGVPLPYLRVLRRTPDGRLWALQTWQVAFSKAVELRFSRWRGAPTQITLAAMPSGTTEVLQGRATFQGRPVTGTSPTNAGKPVLLSGFFDCSGCGAPG